jgi:hypothetical protein
VRPVYHIVSVNAEDMTPPVAAINRKHPMKTRVKDFIVYGHAVHIVYHKEKKCQHPINKYAIWNFPFKYSNFYSFGRSAGILEYHSYITII